ncbi:MAG TPA: aminotransferase class I/II-fold pyridoxal phosphate-dependent enzyme [Nitrospinaceae bacterium]|nr:aminotransferase class I/II-fold pyridoxal phosphate-dependent enzyme [Nitrospinaceae bacterium]
MSELLSIDQQQKLLNLNLGYGQTNGAVPLRKQIADLYNCENEDQVLITNGSAEANYILCKTLLEKDDHVVIMIPNYMQIWGIAEDMGCKVDGFHLRHENDWKPDLNELRNVVTPETKMIVICNPNNPTGYVLSEAEMNEIVSIAKENDVWIHSDEIYRGSELNEVEITSFYGLYDKCIVNGGLSKSYALPGLRIGYLMGPVGFADQAWAYHDYTSISTGIISQYVAQVALQKDNRAKILSRSRKMLQENLTMFTQWVNSYQEIFEFVPPKAGGMAFLKYKLDINSTELSEWLRKEYSVFIVSGDCYGMDGYIRIGIGERYDVLAKGLDIMKNALVKRFNLEGE